jgi:broad specificity phosphatase PhoE
MQHIYLVRHAITKAIEAEIAQGVTDSPLSVLGLKQAQAAAGALASIEFDAVFSSPLGRALETARIICSGRKYEPEIIPDLREMDFGWLEGGPFFDKPQPGTPIWEYLRIFACIIIAQLSGENLRNMSKRAERNWEEIRRRCPQGTILVVSHGIILNYMLRKVLPKEDDTKGYRELSPCSISDLFFEDSGEIRIGRLNCCEHLADLE